MRRLIPLILLIAGFLVVVPTTPAAAQPTTGWANRHLDEIALLDSHNGFANPSDGIGGVVQNHVWSLRDQIRGFGVRSTEMDIRDYDGSVWTAHGDNIGRDYGRPFFELFMEIVWFLYDNPNEVFVLRLEDYSSKSAFITEADRVGGWRELLFNPVTWNVEGNGWPRVQDMINADKRLIIFSSQGDRGDLGIYQDSRFLAQNHWDNGYECVNRPGYDPLSQPARGKFQKLLMINQHTNISNANDYATIYDRIKTRCEPATVGRMPNMISFNWLGTSGGDGPMRFVDDLNKSLRWEVNGSGLCLDVRDYGTADFTPIQIAGCSWNTAQAWRRVPVGNNYFELRALGGCLDVSNGGTANGTPVQLHHCNQTSSQWWIHEGWNGSRLRNPMSGKCLDVPGGNLSAGQRLAISDCTGTVQSWSWNLV